MTKLVPLIIILLSYQFSLGGSSIDIETIDKIYDQNITTVRLFPLIDNPNRELLASAAPLNGQFSLLLQFDHLYADRESYYVKFIHCNADWSPSRLFALDYLDGFNEFQIQEFEYSFNTKVSYVHYQFTLPKFKKSGNYVLVVYRESESDVVLTRRFMIYENRLGLMDDSYKRSFNKSVRGNQQIQFSLNYSSSTIDNPFRNIRTTIRQNQRWDNTTKLLPPSNVNVASGIIDFKQFSGENEFEAGNQFRFFDLRSLRYFGRNVKTVNLQSDIIIATLESDDPRTIERYAENDDLNGNYSITHPYESDYAYVEFFLASEEFDAGKVYLNGVFTQGAPENQFQLEYIPDRKGYYGVYLLKQGFYNYQYLLEGAAKGNRNLIEGNHVETENEYDILVYYHSFREDIDLLIGYFTINISERY